MTEKKIRSYSDKEHELWVSEVKDIYQKVKSHSIPYIIDFLGFQITICPNVFSPKYFNNTKWYAEKLPHIIGNSSLLEIGTGTGAIAIHCCQKGASVTATDINKDALDCAELNFSHTNSNIPTFLGNVFEPLPNESKFDFIFWNHPYNNAKEEINDQLIIAGFDHNYKGLKHYISEAHKYLKIPNKGLLLGTGGHADMLSIIQIAKENDYYLKLLDYCEMPLSEGTTANNDFRIYELIKIKTMEKDNLWKIHSNISDWIKVADSKAVLIIALAGAFVASFGSINSFKIPALFDSIFSLTFLVSSIIFLLISLSAAILSLHSTTKHKSHKSNIFFADIQRFNNYSDYLIELSQNKLEDDLANQIVIISKIATKKHSLLQRSLAFIGLSIFSLVISIVASII